ncbi:Cytidine deaminase [Smittium culicis]|uniref:Cytidine deaminase n=1 Tax=Smittium culicis TaxID=133412 RepID=A0A1R1YM22_9FUNG|nr:Cytidine deaminase [Smittium culicis]OMJ27934.1 Cytidine deaminase [Smittium culicis]
MDYSELAKKSLEARFLSYSPYSDFKVGAALLTESGEIFLGANVENAAYSPCICAERSAFICALMKGHKNFKAIAVSSMVDDYTSPCGVCRQFMREFSADLPIILVKSSGTFIETSLEVLLPMSFGPDDLVKERNE